jgi:hypothetical protein
MTWITYAREASGTSVERLHLELLRYKYRSPWTPGSSWDAGSKGSKLCCESQMPYQRKIFVPVAPPNQVSNPSRLLHLLERDETAISLDHLHYIPSFFLSLQHSFYQ